MNKEELKHLTDAYEKACNNILDAFAEEYDVQTDKDWWVAGDVGGIACVNEEFYIPMDEILLMLRESVPWDEYLRYHDYNMDCAFLKLNNKINLRSWINGAPRYPKEKLEKLKAMHKEVTDLTNQTIKDLEGY